MLPVILTGVSLGLSVFHFAIKPRLSSQSTDALPLVDEPAVQDTSTLMRLMQPTVIAQQGESTGDTLPSVFVGMDYEAMAAMYERYGWDGAYAYLVESGIAKDMLHGKFLINKIFIPEYKSRNPAPTAPTNADQN